MSQKLYVGGLSYNTTNEQLEQLFSECGNVLSAIVITDRDTGRSKGFGFVEMGSPQEATSAISKYDGQSIDGRNISVNEARERAPRQSHSRW